MGIEDSLYRGRLVYLAPLDPEQDAAVESRWSQDPGYLRMVSLEPARPLSPARMKKTYADLERRIDESGKEYYFTIRLREPDGEAGDSAAKAGRRIGFVHLSGISWNSGTAQASLGIGDPVDRRKGYGSDALGLALRYAFTELNLHRLEAVITEYNQAALRLFEKAGFQREVCQRQAVHRDGQRWDLFRLGVLREEWAESRE